MKKNKGITLIALVITIIVLLILAGVAISMLSGENGILNKAKEAKAETSRASFEERIKIAVAGATDYETSKIDKQKLANELGISENEISGDDKDIILKLDGKTFNIKNGKVKETEELKEIDNILDRHFQANGSNYKCRYGFVTGITIDDEKGISIDKVKDLEDALPDSYEVCNVDKSTITSKDTANIETGMIIQKDNNPVATVIIFGDVDGYKGLNMGDSNTIGSIVKGNNTNIEQYKIVASDVNHDGIINNINVYVMKKIDELNESEDAGTEKVEKQIEELEKQLYDGGIVQVFASGRPVGINILKNQSVYAESPNMLKYVTEKEIINNYINSIKKEFYSKGYNIEKVKLSYTLKGITRGTTKVGTLKNLLPSNTVIKCGNTELSNDATIGTDTSDGTYKLYIRSEEYGNDISLANFE